MYSFDNKMMTPQEESDNIIA